MPSSHISVNSNSPYDLRFCTVCNTDQPLRAKHCSDCKRCVGTFDHHCPWLGNCIGEKNKTCFYIYLLLQLLELVSFIVPITAFEDASGADNWFELNAWRLVLLVVECVLLGLLGTLFTVQTYLLSRNITTWECFASKHTSNMNLRRLAAVFNQGVVKNCKLCCWISLQTELYVWSVPSP
jgi:palmitoyltransferase